MSDIVDQETRSRMMSRIGTKNTKPELIIRKALHRRGFRFKIHDKSLPGKPDLVLPRHRAVIFVNGCFWHGHDCSLFKWPKTREAFWRDKIGANKKRDRRNSNECLEQGWRVLTISECALKGRNKLGVERTLDETVRWILSNDTTKTITESSDVRQISRSPG